MINSFTGAYAFLSNYYDPCPMTFEGRLYRNSEAAYQAQKCADESKKDLFAELDPDEAKNLGKRVWIVDDWDDRKADIMRKIVRAKFEQHPELATRLVETGDEELIEGNTWHDNFFGDCQCAECRGIPGGNWLGIILMDEREYRRRA